MTTKTRKLLASAITPADFAAAVAVAYASGWTSAQVQRHLPAGVKLEAVLAMPVDAKLQRKIDSKADRVLGRRAARARVWEA